MTDLPAIYRQQQHLNRKVDELMQLIEAKANTVIQSKWVYKKVAMEITGLCERSLTDETVVRGGNINVNKAGKEYRFLRTDCEKYVLQNSTLPGGQLLINKLKKAS